MAVGGHADSLSGGGEVGYDSARREGFAGTRRALQREDGVAEIACGEHFHTVLGTVEKGRPSESFGGAASRRSRSAPQAASPPSIAARFVSSPLSFGADVFVRHEVEGGERSFRAPAAVRRSLVRCRASELRHQQRVVFAKQRLPCSIFVSWSGGNL